MNEHKFGLAATAGARVIKAADIAAEPDSEQQAENLQAGDDNGS